MIKAFGQNISDSYAVTRNGWIELTNPNAEEIAQISTSLDLDFDDLIAAMDLNETNRIEKFDKYALVIIDTPIKNSELNYKSVPLGIILTTSNIITVCCSENNILTKFHESYENQYAKKDKSEFVYAILLEATMAYQVALLSINRSREKIEQKVQEITGEPELINLHRLESTLVHFYTSIKGNDTVITKMKRYKEMQNISDEQDLLNNILIESQQNLEMARIYREIVGSTRELVSSIMEARLNNVMKRLTSITVILSIPTIVSGIYGMNLNPIGMPFSQIANGFTILLCVIMSICLSLIIFLRLKKFL